MQIDYSQDNEFDINKRLFRRARNNMGETNKAIKDLDDDEKSTAEKNLSIYGAELVNNLKQINYTFRQLEDYVFIPTKETSKRGPKKLVEDIRKPPPPPPDGPEDFKIEFDFSSAKEESKEEGPLGETKEGEDEEFFYDYTKNIDDFKAIEDLADLKKEEPKLAEKIYYLGLQIKEEIENEGGITFGDIFSDDYIDENYKSFSKKIKQLYDYYILLSNTLDQLHKLIEERKYKGTIEVKDFENLKEAYENSKLDLEGKFEDVGLEIPPEGITPTFVKENEDKLDEEGLKTLSDVKEIGEELTKLEDLIEKQKIDFETKSALSEIIPEFSLLETPTTGLPPNFGEFGSKPTPIQFPTTIGDTTKIFKMIKDKEEGIKKYTVRDFLTEMKKLGFEGTLMNQVNTFEKVKDVMSNYNKEIQTPKSKEYLGITFPSKRVDISYLRDMINGRAPIKDVRELFIDEGFTGDDIAKIKAPQIIQILNKYESEYRGSGRYRGGAKTKGPKISSNVYAPSRRGRKPKAQTTSEIPDIPTTPTPPTTPAPIASIDDTDGDFEDETVEREQLTNFDIAKKLKEITIALQNTNQKSPLPAYQNKIDELMTGLIQFIGRTTVLFISKLKKNLKYLDEDLSKQISNELPKFKYNLEILRNYRNKSDKLIKYTLYDQVEKETIGLYNIINDSIRNFSKLKNYISLEPLQGGYFIESSNSFIRQCLNKRFL